MVTIAKYEGGAFRCSRGYACLFRLVVYAEFLLASTIVFEVVCNTDFQTFQKNWAAGGVG